MFQLIVVSEVQRFEISRVNCNKCERKCNRFLCVHNFQMLFEFDPVSVLSESYNIRKWNFLYGKWNVSYGNWNVSYGNWFFFKLTGTDISVPRNYVSSQTSFFRVFLSVQGFQVKNLVHLI